MNIEQAITSSSALLSKGANSFIIYHTLLSEGFSKKQASTIVKWAMQNKIKNMKTYRIRNWSIVSSNPFQAPEINKKSLYGIREGEDQPVITSAIVKVDGKYITTYSGSVYILEDINPEYLTWMIDNGYDYDPNNPIMLKKIS